MGRTLGYILIANVSFAGAAYGQAPRGVLEADMDHDGVVTRAEFIAMNTARFERMDANHDGKLSIEERIPERAPNGLPPLNRNAPARPGGVDANGDGMVSRDEFFLNIGTIWSRYDTNRDDRITGDEIAPAAPSKP